MKLIVLYREDGRIVSLSRTPAQTRRDDRGIPPLHSGVAPGDGQRSAIVEVDAGWHDRPLAEIHRHFVVVRHGDEVRLQPTARD
jgi:hypothetical protein